jgi:hypothetical protein
MKFVKTIAVSTLLSLASLGAVAGCSSTVDGSTEPVETGTLDLGLTGAANGVTYRLRNALFDITGPTATTLDSEIDPNAPELVLTLPVGHYQVFLQPGWALERMDPGGAVPVHAMLVSPNPAAAQVIGGSRAHSVFRFQTDGTVVDIGFGELSVSIGVEVVSGGGGECLAYIPDSCPAPEACYLTGAGSVCAPAGSLPPGASCQAANDCMPGYTCADLGGGLVCTEVCQVGATCSNGSICEDIGLGSESVCFGEPGGGGGGGGGSSCSYSDPSSCPPGEDCYPTDMTGGNTCAPAGWAQPGESCMFLNDCIEDYICLDDGTGARCYERCLEGGNTCASPTTCTNVGIADLAVCY